MAIRNNPCKTELKIARSQRNRLRTISEKLAEMACEWDGFSGWLETGSEALVEAVDKHRKDLDEQIEEWSKG